MYNKFVLTAVIMLFSILSVNFCAAKAISSLPESNSYLFIPAGIKCEAVLSENIHSSSTIVGQNVSVILINDLKYNNKLIASSGSTISGTITQNKIAGKGSNKTEMKIRFTTIRTPYNNIIPISAVVLGDNKSGYLYAENKKVENTNSIILLANSKINLLFDQPITVTAQ